MMRTWSLLQAHLVLATAQAQVVNGSFESNGAPDLSGWTATCPTPMPGPGHPDWGDFGVAIPHGENNGCSGSFLYQLVPGIQDGDSRTFTGWCMNLLPGISNPYIGLRMGVKLANGGFLYFTPALMNTSSWTQLSVTNTFTLSPGDTAVVLCDAGVVSGFRGGNFAVFDGLELSDPSTIVEDAGTRMRPALFPNPASERLWVDATDDILEVEAVDMTGRAQALKSLMGYGTSLEVDVSSVPSGPCVLLLRSAAGVSSLRFIKT